MLCIFKACTSGNGRNCHRIITGDHFQINTLTFTKPAEVFGILGLTYFVLCFGLSRLAHYVERRLARRGLGTHIAPAIAT